MFLDFYHLREQPFGVTPDPRFLFLSRAHLETLASLFYGVETGRGFMSLVADPGMGKTTLLFQFIERLRKSACAAFLFQTQCNSRELLRYLLTDMGIDSTGLDLVGMHEQLNQALIRVKQAGMRFVLIIDEAQNLDESVLETVRLLSNFETQSSKLIQIVLAGQPQLADKLARPGLIQLRQRVSILCRLNPFTPEEAERYIEHRLVVAGYNGGPLFTPAALAMIIAQSKGIPRNINNLCFNALSLGYALGRRTIDPEIIREVVADLELDLPAAGQRSLQRPLSFASQPASTVPVAKLKETVGVARWAFRAAALALCNLLVGLIPSPSFTGERPDVLHNSTLTAPTRIVTSSRSPDRGAASSEQALHSPSSGSGQIWLDRRTRGTSSVLQPADPSQPSRRTRQVPGGATPSVDSPPHAQGDEPQSTRKNYP